MHQSSLYFKEGFAGFCCRIHAFFAAAGTIPAGISARDADSILKGISDASLWF